ncbi:MAG: alpha/beta fold hydrolase [Actinomycetota bacterium]
MDAKRFQVTAPDGRSLDAAVAGPEDGTPLVFHHGTPGAVILFEPFIEDAATRAFRFITYSRPGYGGSTRHPGRSVADCATDVSALVDHLGAPRFCTIGWSGGGPHALACAALLPDRVIAAATIAGVAPYPAEGLDWMAGMGEENVEEFGAALAGPEALGSYLEREAKALADLRGDDIIEALGDLVSDVDKAALTGALGEFLAGNFHEALGEGMWGWFDDDLAFVRNWEFSLSSIRVPATIWQGAHDRMVPFAHGKWLAASVPSVRPRLEPDHGHLSLAVGSFGRILDVLITNGRAEG